MLFWKIETDLLCMTEREGADKEMERKKSHKVWRQRRLASVLVTFRILSF
jgi:hypothetical protein